MACFNNSPEDHQRLDWQILRDGAIALYWRDEYLREDTQWFIDHGYRAYEFDCAAWTSKDDLFSAFGTALDFPEWWGRNFDALNDCMDDIPLTEENGAVLVLTHFDSYARGCGAVRLPIGRTQSNVLLDIIARASRFHLLNRRRLGGPHNAVSVVWGQIRHSRAALLRSSTWKN